MKKPKITANQGFYDEWPELCIDGKALDVVEIKERYEAMIDAFIEIKSNIDNLKKALHDEGYIGTASLLSKDIERINEALIKAGCK